MFKDYDPAAEKDVSCNFLIVHIGDGSLEEIKTHLHSCEDCRLEVERNYYFYKDGQYAGLFEEIPPGLSIEEFFSTHHLVLMRKMEINEHFMGRLEKGLGGNFSVLLRLVRRLHKVVQMKANHAPPVLMENEYRLLENCYRDLIKVLGQRETYLFFELKDDKDGEDKFEELLAAWRSLLDVRVASEEGK